MLYVFVPDLEDVCMEFTAYTENEYIFKQYVNMLSEYFDIHNVMEQVEFEDFDKAFDKMYDAMEKRDYEVNSNKIGVKDTVYGAGYLTIVKSENPLHESLVIPMHLYDVACDYTASHEEADYYHKLLADACNGVLASVLANYARPNSGAIDIVFLMKLIRKFWGDAYQDLAKTEMFNSIYFNESYLCERFLRLRMDCV